MLWTAGGIGFIVGFLAGIVFSAYIMSKIIEGQPK